MMGGGVVLFEYRGIVSEEFVCAPIVDDSKVVRFLISIKMQITNLW